MKFFISGQIDDVEDVRGAMNAVKNAGHSITHDWTETDAFLGGVEQKLANRTESGKRAKKDIDGVLAADVYVLISDNVAVGKGMYVELGAAIAAYEKTGKPKVYVVGKLNHLSVFYLHPSVVRKDSIADVIATL